MTRRSVTLRTTRIVARAPWGSYMAVWLALAAGIGAGCGSVPTSTTSPGPMATPSATQTPAATRSLAPTGFPSSASAAPSGLFQRAFQVPVGEHPQGIAAVDLNEDGRLDLVSTNEQSSDVSVLLQQPDGSFAPQGRHPAGPGNAYVAAADLDADGHADVVTTNGGHATGTGEIQPGNDTVSVLFGTGDGDLRPRVDFPAGETPVGLAISDVNGDGIPDIAVANRHAGAVTVLFGDRDWRKPRIESVRIPGLTLTRWLAIADVTGDRFEDLIVPDELGTKVWVAAGRGDGTFKRAKGHETSGSQPVAVSPADLNGDGALDLAVANGYPSRDLSVLLNIGDGRFAAPVKYLVGTFPHSVFAGDIDADGLVDLVSGNDFDGTITVLSGRGDGTFQPGSSVPTGSAGGLGMILVRDIDGDGLVDVVSANWDPANDLSILLGACPRSSLQLEVCQG